MHVKSFQHPSKSCDNFVQQLTVVKLVQDSILQPYKCVSLYGISRSKLPGSQFFQHCDLWVSFNFAGYNVIDLTIASQSSIGPLQQLYYYIINIRPLAICWNHVFSSEIFKIVCGRVISYHYYSYIYFVCQIMTKIIMAKCGQQ